MQPWKLLADPSGYIFKWLVGYSGGLGSIAGVLIADYFFVRKTRRLVLADLYRADGVYRYTRGWNVPPSVATLAGCALRVGRRVRSGAASAVTTTPGSSASSSPPAHIWV